MKPPRPESGRPGLERVARAALDRIRSRPLSVQRRLIYSFDLGTPVPRVESPLPLRFEIAPDAAASSEPQGESESSELVLRAMAGGEVVYQMRIALRRQELLRLLSGCPIPPRPIFFYDCFTNPAFRGKGAYPASLVHALGFARERGYDRAYIRVERRNVPSIVGIERAGFTPIAIIIHAALFGVPIGPFGWPARWPATSTPGREDRRP